MQNRGKNSSHTMDIFKEEFDVLDRANQVATDSGLNLAGMQKEYQFLKHQFEKLLKETVNLIKISDVYQKKLLMASEQIKRQREDLQTALSEIKTLNGLLPICVNCKSIRDDRGYWQRVEIYIAEHSDADFTHCLCPGCAQTLYPNIFLDEENGSL